MDYEEYFEQMGTDTAGRYDISPLFGDADTFAALRTDLCAGVDSEPTVVVGIDALGFVLGSAVATEMSVGFVPVRQGGKLPYPDDELLRRDITDYSEDAKSLELHPDELDVDDRALVVDDWIETGTQMRAATDLVESAGASVVAVAAIRAHRNEGTKPLFERYDVHALRTGAE
ncbi:phosphoribosyltransferase family protein [Halopelagius fulvigenes]|uniref:adenine phosphoribosyltransferase n=1 Tax=Halopelagius fulvigenes TaxID=1198324 RepID=A0ABD5U6V2_9EURY